MKKIFKNPFFTFILGSLIFGGIGVVYAYSIFANDIGFEPNNSSWNVSNVKDALDDLYKLKSGSQVYEKLFNNNKYTLHNDYKIKKDSNNDYYFEFDGVDDYISLATIPATDDFTNGFTVEAKAKWYNFNNYSRIFDIGNGPESNNITLDNYGTTSQLQFLSRNDSDGVMYGNSNAMTLDQNQIVSIKIEAEKVENNSYSIKYYKNGNLISEDTTNNSYFKNIERKNNYIGKSNWDSNDYFKGAIYYVRLKDLNGNIIFNVNANEIFK